MHQVLGWTCPERHPEPASFSGQIPDPSPACYAPPATHPRKQQTQAHCTYWLRRTTPQPTSQPTCQESPAESESAGGRAEKGEVGPLLPGRGGLTCVSPGSRLSQNPERLGQGRGRRGAPLEEGQVWRGKEVSVPSLG